MSYNIVALISGILGIYGRYNFVHVFREEGKNKKFHDLLLFSIFYVTLQIVYIRFDIPILNLLVQVFFLSCILIYSGVTLKKSLVATLLIIVITVSIDGIVCFITGFVSESILLVADYNSIIGVVSIDVIILLVSVIVKNYKNVKLNIALPFAYWFAILIFPVASLVLLIIIFGLSTESQLIAVCSTVMVLIMNMVILWLYDHLIRHYNREIDDAITKQINRSYIKQLQMMRMTVMNTKSIEHDFSKHLVGIKSLITQERYFDSEMYIEHLLDSLKSNCTISNTGNIIIDSIINFEVSQYEVDIKKIKLKTTEIPNRIAIKDHDLTVILSNIISNALKASENALGDIVIHLNYTKGIFYILVTNYYENELIVENDKFITTSKDKLSHGYGIDNVKRAVNKYNGDLTIGYENNEFRVEIVIYEDR